MAPGPSATRCPYCLAALASELDAVVRCAACRTPHHRACFLEHGRCTLLGCHERNTVAEDAAPPAPGSLHPFLPWGKQRIRRRASFLSVQVLERDRRAGRVRVPSLELSCPPRATCRERFELELVARSPQAIRGLGLRLRVASKRIRPQPARELAELEAVIAGRASRGWLTRLKLWTKERPRGVLAAGTTRWRLAFEPSFLAWRGPLVDEGFGPAHALELSAQLEGTPTLRSASCRVELADGRPSPPALGDEPPAAEEANAPPLGAGEGWAPAPILAGEPAPAAYGAARDRFEPAAGYLDAIDLRLPRAQPTRLKVLGGTVLLELERERLPGQVRLELTCERKDPGKLEWRPVSREQLVLAAGSGRRAVAGLHRLDFEYPLPPVLFWSRRRAKRRVRAQALLDCGGRPLRSLVRETTIEG